MAIKHRVVIVLLAAIARVCAQTTAEQPVGLIIDGADAQLLRAGTNAPLHAESGNILFTGDSLKTAAGSPTIVFCPAGVSLTLQPASESLFGPKDVRIKSGRSPVSKPTPFCLLPLVERTPVATARHYGASVGGGRSTAPLRPVPPEVTAELAPVDRQIALDAHDLAAHVARAALLEKHLLLDEAMAEYSSIRSEWPGASWISSRLFADGTRARDVQTTPDRPHLPTGKTYALLVGVSAYQNERVPPLQFAHADAELFAAHLRTPRGGQAEITLLTDAQASMTAIRLAIAALLQRKAGKDDTVLLFFAAHGLSVGNDGYILAADSDPSNLKDTALSMSEVQSLFERDLSAVGHVILYVDACHAGVIGSIRGANRINDVILNAISDQNEVFGMMASRKDQTALEGSQYGNHGVFSLYMVQALNGAADLDGNGVIDATEVVDYVQRKVAEATLRKQSPKEIGNAGQGTILADVSKPGLDNGEFGLQTLSASALPSSLPGVVGASPAAVSRGIDSGMPAASSDEDSLREFDEAIAAGRLLPGDGGAFDYLAQLRQILPAREVPRQEDRLRVALEDRGQQVILRYLKGDQTPQLKSDFVACAADFNAARLLTPESLFLEAREDFCVGRAALFDRAYGRGVTLLERSVRIDPGAAYAYNALGIAHLEQADYRAASLAFLDAIQRAPYWAYPRHNQALASLQSGDADEAIRLYQQAIPLEPGFAYLRYNLGLIYQQVNRRQEAQDAFRQAIQIDPQLADAWNALGYWNTSAGHDREAERLYRQALAKDAGLLSARQNLAVLLSREPARSAEALALWQENLRADPAYLPSRVSLARSLESTGNLAGAIAEYRRIVTLEPKFAGARNALAGLERKAGDLAGALADLEMLLTVDGEDPDILEATGDVQSDLGKKPEALLHYRLAQQHAITRSARNRLGRKIKAGQVGSGFAGRL